MLAFSGRQTTMRILIVEDEEKVSRFNFFLTKSKKEKGPTLTPAVDAFNVFNRVNFVAFVGNLSSPFFGQAVVARPPRRLQLSLRMTF